MKRFIPALLILLCISTNAHAFLGLFDSSIKEVQPKNGIVEINTTDLKSQQAAHYVIKLDNTSIRFFVVRDTQGTARVAMDACEVCWKDNKGYKLNTNAMLCVNCGQKFALQNIGKVKGGCNPHPIQFETTATSVRILAEELLQNAYYFPKSK